METVKVKSILGVQISDNLKWKQNTNFIVTKARGKIWMLRQFLPLKLSNLELFDVYVREVRSVLEYAVPVWHSGLTQKQSSDIEAVQKLAFKLTLRQKYTDYAAACQILNTHTLEQRHAKKNLLSDKSFFTLPNANVNLRQRKQKVTEFKCNTSRFQRSSIPFLASLINSEL